MINTYNQRSPQKESSTSMMKMAMWIFALFFMAQIIGTSFFGVYFYKRLDKMENEINVHDDYVFLRTIQKCRRKENSDTTLLDCKKVVAKLQDLTNQVTENNIPGEMPKADLPLTAQRVGEKPSQDVIETEKAPVAVHLVGEKSNNTKVLQWMLKGYAAMRRQIAYSNGKLRVEMPGVYYVYSQVSFCVTTKSSRAPFVQYIYLHRQHEMDKLLLKGANAITSQTGDCSLHSVQQGAIFTLKQNDQLFVNVTDSSCINYSPGLTYFGMFKL